MEKRRRLTYFNFKAIDETLENLYEVIERSITKQASLEHFYYFFDEFILDTRYTKYH